MKKNKVEFSGLFVYKQGNYYVYSAPLSKKGYRFTSAELKQFQFFSSRFIIPFCAAVVLYFFSKNMLISVISIGAIFLIMETTFRNNLLKKLPIIDNFEKTNKISIFDQINSNVDRKQLLVPLFLLLALTVAIVANALINYQGEMLIANLIGASVTLLVFIFFVIAYIKNRS